MALRKFLFMNGTEGYSQEQAASDELALGKATFSGVSGVAIDAGGQLISSVGAPVSGTDAARKTDVDNAASAANSYTDQKVGAEAALRQAADTQLSTNISNEATARQNADTQLTTDLTNEVNRAQAAEAAITTAYQAADTTERNARIAADSDLSTAITNEVNRATGAESGLSTAISNEATRAQGVEASLSTAISNEATRAQGAESALSTAISNEATARASADSSIRTDFAAADSALQTDYIARDTVVLNSAKSYADNLLSGFIVKAPAKAVAVANITLSGEQTIDGVPLVAGDRVLVAGQSDATKNGLYVVAAGTWSRSQDFNDDAEMKDGVSVFIEQGGVYHDSTWVLITNNPIVLGTTALTFVQFSGLGQIIAGDGLSKTDNTLNVNPGKGIKIDADAVAVKLATYPALQFSGAGSDELAVKTQALGGLDIGGSGLFVKVDGQTTKVEIDNTLQVIFNADKGLYNSGSGLGVVVNTAKGLAVDHNGIGIVLAGAPGDGMFSGMQFSGTGHLAVQTPNGSGLVVGASGVSINPDNNRGFATDGTGAYVVVNGSKAMAVDASGLAVKYDDQKAMAMDATKGLQVVADATNGIKTDATAGLQVKFDATKAMAMDATAGLQVVVDETQGLHIDATAGLQATIAANSGLQFTGGKFDLKLASANTLSKDASGLTVTGVPSLFKVDGVATSANVTAVNLGTLTGAAAADALHYHDGIKGVRAAAGSIAQGKAVYVSASNTVSAASCSSSATARVMGISVAASAMGAVVVQHAGALAAFSGLSAGTPYYLGSDGSPVEFSSLVSGDRVIRLGFALNATTMEVCLQDMGAKA